MTLRYQSIKPVLLMVAMSLGFAIQALPAKAADRQSITVAGGCFWCVESDFESVDGVLKAVSGFSGGDSKNPTYKQVVGGGTGHREAVKITYDADKVSTRELLDLFFRSVDPTDANGQFCDRGFSYSTAIYVENDAQRSAAEAAKAAAEKELGKAIVTPIETFKGFYKASRYHQDYYKSKSIVVTRFGPKTKAEAYKRYRKACGRDAQIERIWGANAPFLPDVS